MWSNWNFYTFLMGMYNDTTILKNRLVISHKVKHTANTGPSNSTYRYLYENLRLHKNYMMVHKQLYSQ